MPWISHPCYLEMVKSSQLLGSHTYFDPFAFGPASILRAHQLQSQMIESQEKLSSAAGAKATAGSAGRASAPSPSSCKTQDEERQTSSASPPHRSKPSRSSSVPSVAAPPPAAVTTPTPTSSPDRLLQPLRLQSPNASNHQQQQLLPPSCGAKQLSKLKRFLTTLQKFGSDISPEVGNKVRNLVRALVNSQLSIEDFHTNLQETTNFPLKPFVIPFLKAALPLLQAELLHCAQISRLSPHQYLAKNEKLLFEASSPSEDAMPILLPPVSAPMPTPAHQQAGASKRKNPNPTSTTDRPAAKRPAPATHSISQSLLADTKLPTSSASSSADFSLNSLERPFVTTNRSPMLPSPATIKLDEISRLSHSRLEHSLTAALESNRLFSQPIRTQPDMDATDRMVMNDSWEHITTMLDYITTMVDKTKTAFSTLREMKIRETHELALLMRRQAEGMDLDLKKRTGEMMSQTLRQTEDKIADIKQKADDMVNDMKRRAIIEIQSAVTAAELKANELISQEKSKMEQSVQKIRQLAKEEALRTLNCQVESQETCWNCGRRASETCSGCNKARYCGQFCQHKDWDRHHSMCGSSRANNTNSESNDDSDNTPTKSPDGVKPESEDSRKDSNNNRGSTAEFIPKVSPK